MPLSRVRSHRGFSLTQLLATLAIIGILFAIALPNYTRQRMRAVRAQGEGCLMHVAKLEEEYYTRNNSQYMTNNANLVSLLQIGSPNCAETLGGSAADASYIISVATVPTSATACPATQQAFCYCVIANPQGAQTQDGVLAVLVDTALPDPGLRVRKLRFNTLTSASSCPDPGVTAYKAWSEP